MWLSHVAASCQIEISRVCHISRMFQRICNQVLWCCPKWWIKCNLYMQALHVLQHSQAEVSVTPFSPTENMDFSSHLDILCLHKILLSRNLCKLSMSGTKQSIQKAYYSCLTESLSARAFSSEMGLCWWIHRKYWPQKINIKPEPCINYLTAVAGKQEFQYMRLNNIHTHMHRHTKFQLLFSFCARKNLGYLETLIFPPWNSVKHRILITEKLLPSASGVSPLPAWELQTTM